MEARRQGSALFSVQTTYTKYLCLPYQCLPYYSVKVIHENSKRNSSSLMPTPDLWGHMWPLAVCHATIMFSARNCEPLHLAVYQKGMNLVIMREGHHRSTQSHVPHISSSSKKTTWLQCSRGLHTGLKDNSLMHGMNSPSYRVSWEHLCHKLRSFTGSRHSAAIYTTVRELIPSQVLSPYFLN